MYKIGKNHFYYQNTKQCQNFLPLVIHWVPARLSIHCHRMKTCQKNIWYKKIDSDNVYIVIPNKLQRVPKSVYPNIYGSLIKYGEWCSLTTRYFDILISIFLVSVLAKRRHTQSDGLTLVDREEVTGPGGSPGLRMRVRHQNSTVEHLTKCQR